MNRAQRQQKAINRLAALLLQRHQNVTRNVDQNQVSAEIDAALNLAVPFLTGETRAQVEEFFDGDLCEETNACPRCGERLMDNLPIQDDERIRCSTCNRVYDPGTKPDGEVIGWAFTATDDSVGPTLTVLFTGVNAREDAVKHAGHAAASFEIDDVPAFVRELDVEGHAHRSSVLYTIAQVYHRPKTG